MEYKRSDYIEILQKMLLGKDTLIKFSEDEREALEFAIESLKVDEMYQLEYEGTKMTNKRRG